MTPLRVFSKQTLTLLLIVLPLWIRAQVFIGAEGGLVSSSVSGQVWVNGPDIARYNVVYGKGFALLAGYARNGVAFETGLQHAARGHQYEGVSETTRTFITQRNIYTGIPVSVRIRSHHPTLRPYAGLGVLFSCLTSGTALTEKIPTGGEGDALYVRTRSSSGYNALDIGAVGTAGVDFNLTRYPAHAVERYRLNQAWAGVTVSYYYGVSDIDTSPEMTTRFRSLTIALRVTYHLSSNHNPGTTRVTGRR